MSFILDALKKSESERQRKAGPALYEVKLAPPRNRLPWWMITVGALLGVNLVFVVWLLIRSPSPAPAAAPVAIAATAPTAAIATPPVASPAPAAVAPVAPAQTPVQTAAPISAGAPTLNGSLSGVAGTALPATSAAPSDDLAPAVEPPADSGTGHVRMTTEAGLPGYREIAATNNRIPPLHLDFHLYAARPQDRFVFINMKKLHEGDATPEGVRVESINDEGAVLSFEGTRFTLLHE